MRRMIAVGAMALLAVGCAGSPPPESAPSYDYTPLDAYIMAPSGGLRFHVSRPAYVALFEIIPGHGTQLLYPAAGHGRLDGHIFAGDRVVRSRGFRDSHYYLTGGARGMGAVGEPRFLFLLASERPLRLEQFGPSGYGLRQAMGFRTYASPYAAMERLAELSLPSMIDDGSWTSDFYVFWPEVLQNRGSSREVLVRCNGYQMLVPYAFVGAAQREICGRRTADDGDRPRPARPEPDSTEIAKPGRRSPLPPETQEGRPRVVNSRQLQQPESWRPESRPVERGRVATPETGAGTGEVEQPERGRAVRARPGGGAPAIPAAPAVPATPVREAPARPPRATPAPERQSRPERTPERRPVATPAAAPERPASPPSASPRPARPARETPPQPAPQRRSGKGCDPCGTR